MNIRWMVFTYALPMFLVLHVAAQKTSVVSSHDIKSLVGCWQGTLNYSGTIVRKPYSTTATLHITQGGNPSQFKLLHIYTKDPHDQTTDTITISTDGKKMNGAAVKSKQIISSGNIEITTEFPGFDSDHNKAALIRRVYDISNNAYSIRKYVLVEGQSEWQEREEFIYARKSCEEN